MKIAIIDADLIGRKKHRFPNLACMKLSGYHLAQGDYVVLKTDYNDLNWFDQVYISKVFTDTLIDENILKLPNVKYGGTGFFYDKASNLPVEIEHHMPDYHLYDNWVKKKIDDGGKKSDFAYYTDYSIGFLTRGCFRQCSFCVNKKYKRVEEHSPLEEFIDPKRKKICLLDDNFLGCPNWRELLLTLQNTKKSFQFKQGLDERLLTDEKCEILFNSKYDGDYIFAFDNVADYDLIKDKLILIRRYTNKRLKFYTLCGYDRNNNYDNTFWQQDLWDLWKRIELLMQYQALPYIMRFNRYTESPYAKHYIALARWCNQPGIFKRTSFRELSMARSTEEKYLKDIEKQMPELAARYFDLKWQ